MSWQTSFLFSGADSASPSWTWRLHAHTHTLTLRPDASPDAAPPADDLYSIRTPKFLFSVDYYHGATHCAGAGALRRRLLGRRALRCRAGPGLFSAAPGSWRWCWCWRWRWHSHSHWCSRSHGRGRTSSEHGPGTALTTWRGRGCWGATGSAGWGCGDGHIDAHHLRVLACYAVLSSRALSRFRISVAVEPRSSVDHSTLPGKPPERRSLAAKRSRSRRHEEINAAPTTRTPRNPLGARHDVMHPSLRRRRQPVPVPVPVRAALPAPRRCIADWTHRCSAWLRGGGTSLAHSSPILPSMATPPLDAPITASRPRLLPLQSPSDARLRPGMLLAAARCPLPTPAEHQHTKSASSGASLHSSPGILAPSALA